MLLDEPLIFERGAPGRVGWPVAESLAGEPAVPALPPALQRDDSLAGFPEVSELEVVRHFVRLSQWNYSAATTLYPLGSCTMKYNPVVNEALCGYQVAEVSVDGRGLLPARAVAAAMDESVAALMVTNPNTLGLFEEEIEAVAAAVHARGGLVYMDGANFNALMGVARPGDMGVDVMQFNLHKTFSTPHGGGGPGAGPVAVRAPLAEYLPVPRLVRTEAGLAWSEEAPKSVGRMRSFYGNFGVLVRAFAYIARLGAAGLPEVTRLAVLNANYVRARLQGTYHLPYDTPSLHECVFSDRHLQDFGVSTLDVAKRLLDYGFYAPTIYFPLVVKGALMIEPTETETKETLDAFVEALLAIAEEARTDPAKLRQAPHRTRLARLDETRAARRPVLRWQGR